MAKMVVIEELHVTVYVPRDLPANEADDVRRTLGDPAFEARLLRALKRVFRREAALARARVRLSR